MMHVGMCFWRSCPFAEHTCLISSPIETKYCLVFPPPLHFINAAFLTSLTPHLSYYIWNMHVFSPLLLILCALSFLFALSYSDFLVWLTLLPWKRRYCIFLEHWYISAGVCGVTSRMTSAELLLLKPELSRLGSGSHGNGGGSAWTYGSVVFTLTWKLLCVVTEVILT